MLRSLSRRFGAMAFVVFAAQLAANPVEAQEVRRLPFQPGPDFVGWVDDTFIVVLRPGTRPQVDHDPSGRPRVQVPSLQRLLERHGVQGFEALFGKARAPVAGSRRPDLTGHFRVRLPAADLEPALLEFAADPTVARVERIGMHAVHAAPNDPYFQDSPNPNFPFDQWSYWDAHGVNVDQAWDTQTGDADVIVAILDSGVRYFHADLGGSSLPWGPANPFSGGNIFINAEETPGNSQDDDNNGFVDDVVGWDFVTQAGGGGVTCLDADCSGADNDPDDGLGHGTHVAGTVGAITNNGSSVAGVAGGWSDGSASGTGNGVKILPLRMGYLARFQGTVTGVVRMDWAAQAMQYVADLVDAGVNVTAVNCSWSSSNSGGLGEAVDDLIAHDVLVVHSAGNSNSSTADYLGSRTDVMNVAATNRTGNGATFTNHGSWVDVAAPGVEILSTYRSPDDPDPTHHYIALMDGTSMSAPHITGIAALLESCNPALTRAQKFALIVNNTDPYTDVRLLGSGIANAAEAIAAGNCVVPCDLAANFSATTTSGCAPLVVGFTDLSTGTGISAWAWNFGDGGTSALQHAVHLYTAAGTYSVRLIVSGGSCSDTLVATALVTVQPPEPVAAFTGTPTMGEVPLQVDFTDESAPVPSAWSWDFGDGNGSTEQHPSHTYQSPGTYDVTLVATNACGADTLVQPSYVVANPSTTSVPFEDVGQGLATWAWPNPCGPSTQVFFRLEREAEVEIVVYDVAGRPVRRLAARRFGAGPHALAFDGTDDRRHRLAAGLYIYRFVAAGRVETRKLVVSR